MQSILTSLPLAITDFGVLWVILFASTSLVERAFDLPTTFITRYTSLLASLVLVPAAALAGLYPALGISPFVEFRQLVSAVALALTIFTGIEVLRLESNWEYAFVCSAIAFLIAIPVVPTARYFIRLVCSQFSWWGERILILSEKSYGRETFDRLRRIPERGFRPVGLLLWPEEQWDAEDNPPGCDIQVFDARRAIQVAEQLKASWVLINPVESTEHSAATKSIVEDSIGAIPNRIVLSAGQLDLGVWDQSQTIGTACGIRVAGPHRSTFSWFMKRQLDIFLTVVGGLMIAPLVGLISIAIKATSPGPVFYSQPRIGRGGTSFRAWKFRTMAVNADEVLAESLAKDPALQKEWDETHKLKNDPRVTRMGRFLRQTSLDELPQLWNILVGDMSLVGPRPIVDSSSFDRMYIDDFPREFSSYTSVRPGLTGLWQVTCRNNGVYEMRIYWDVYYVRNWSLWLDLYILLRTVRTVALREGAY
ncbi:MAG TPA: exopolysaccharide biosynthesis polyprenyl glycosylphosphotransferase [Planctomycetaceae bacterium]|nr:exopolysaccharide biosynthesis polyprenyl glycosylphosphotransferase [Planctomycetaceae bacterium]